MESHRYASSLPCCVFAFSFAAESILPGDTGHGAEGLEDTSSTLCDLSDQGKWQHVLQGGHLLTSTDWVPVVQDLIQQARVQPQDLRRHAAPAKAAEGGGAQPAGLTELARRKK
ncbi:unnamed protein product [Effrenium voratum]|nr:unnamed protein product [Effrenium voratum]